MKKEEETFNLTNKTRGTIPGVDFLDIKNAVLGKSYCLSLVLIGQKRSRWLNKSYRGKDKPANILSFPLDKKLGEIFIAPSAAKDYSIGFLFIHGLLHLKGMGHGSRMEEVEKKLRKKFGV